MFMCGERSQSKSKHSIFRICKKKNYVLQFFFGEASFALCSEVTRPQLMLDWGMAIYENLFAAVSGSIDCESPPNENVCALLASGPANFVILLKSPEPCALLLPLRM